MAKNDIISISQSPFDKKKYHEKYIRGEPKKPESIRIPKTVHKDLMKYFEENGMGFSEGVNQILADRLQMINSSDRICFNNIELIMLLPQVRNIDDLNYYSHIIGVINTDKDFIDGYNHDKGFKKDFNIQYDLEGFWEKPFPMDIINSTRQSCIQGVNLEDLKEWDSFKSKVYEIYGYNSFAFFDFVRIPLNNYLDVKREGEFQHPQYRGKHRGLYVFDDFYNKRIYCIIDWEYSGENGQMEFDVRFVDGCDFHELIIQSEHDKLINYYKSLENVHHDEEFFKKRIEEAEKMIAYHKDELEFYKGNLNNP